MHRLVDRLPFLSTTMRAALVVFVLAWIFGPYELRSAVPVWVAFLIALGLEINFLVGAIGRPSPQPDRGPQPVDRERFGYLGWPDEDEEEEAGEVDEEEHPGIAGPRAAVPRGAWASSPRSPSSSGSSRAGRGWDSLSVETRTEAQDRFSEEASLIAEKPVRIRCDESGAYVGAVQHTDGVATVGGDLAYLTPERCLDLYRLAFEGEVTGSQTGRSIVVLAHEAWHLHGVDDEGTTECYAIQSGVALGQRLGPLGGTPRDG